MRPSTEVPFSGSELSALAKLARSVPLRPVYVSGVGTLVDHGVNSLPGRVSLPLPPVTQVHVPVLDYIAYHLLLLPVVMPGEPAARG